MRYNQIRFYNPILDCECLRFSAWNEHGHEFFSVISLERSGARRREIKERVLDALEDAMNMPDAQPGEVRVGTA